MNTSNIEITSTDTSYTYSVTVLDGSASIVWTDADDDEQTVHSSCPGGVLSDVPEADQGLLTSTVAAMVAGTYVDGVLVGIVGRASLDDGFVRATVSVRMAGYEYEGGVSLVRRADGRGGLETAGGSLDAWASDEIASAVLFGREQGHDVAAYIVDVLSEAARGLGIPY